MIIWNSEKSTYYDAGRRAYGYGDEIPEDILDAMGEETVAEYLEKGLLAESDGKASNGDTTQDDAEKQRLELMEKAKSMGLNPHPATGIPKLEKAIEEAEALAALKKEALALGIDPADNVTYDELKKLVDEKKA